MFFEPESLKLPWFSPRVYTTIHFVYPFVLFQESLEKGEIMSHEDFQKAMLGEIQQAMMEKKAAEEDPGE